MGDKKKAVELFDLTFFFKEYRVFLQESTFLGPLFLDQILDGNNVEEER